MPKVVVKGSPNLDGGSYSTLEFNHATRKLGVKWIRALDELDIGEVDEAVWNTVYNLGSEKGDFLGAS